MAFDKTAFMKQQFVERTEKVSVPSLKSWFSEDETVEWEVRGQTSVEIARASESASKTKDIVSVVKAIGDSKEKIEELKQVLGMSEDVPDSVAIRMEQLVMCSIEPICDMSMAVKLAETYPTEFYTLTNRIVYLTHLGMDIPK